MKSARTRRRLVAWLAAIALAGAVALVGGVYWLDEQDRHPAPDSGRPGSWVTGATSARVADFAHLRIPASAVELHWGYQIGFQGDYAVLSFRLPEGDTAGFVQATGVVRWDTAWPPDGTALKAFQHIGAADPTALPMIRRGSLVPESPGHDATGVVIWIASEPGGTDQIWVEAVDSY
ncbi:hypothetical protein ACFVVX_17715 [Kitasatospora sp. NPDC058170]|uniref:hypothetical protein n=1 Tax=Kitasatospora sp. NPDC058170 TaxID=3346364 RepID=UPI0036DD9DBB